MGKKLLIVEDEKSIMDILSFNLNREGYEIVEAEDGVEGYNKAVGELPDLILLDVMLPGMDGFEVCRRIRDGGSSVPIIMLTAREEETDKVLGLELGADDYITKPFSMRELLARIKANIRRSEMDEAAVSEDENFIAAGGLKIDKNRHEVYKNGNAAGLTQREFELVLFLAEAKNKVFSREELLQKVWDYEYYGDARTVDVTVRRLREKIEDNPSEPRYVVTKRGAGYMFSSV
jgi:two-component system response regulator VicR